MVDQRWFNRCLLRYPGYIWLQYSLSSFNLKTPEPPAKPLCNTFPEPAQIPCNWNHKLYGNFPVYLMIWEPYHISLDLQPLHAGMGLSVSQALHSCSLRLFKKKHGKEKKHENTKIPSRQLTYSIPVYSIFDVYCLQSSWPILPARSKKPQAAELY